MVMDGHDLGSDAELLDSLTRCWTSYPELGRLALSSLGEKVSVAPVPSLVTYQTRIANGGAGWLPGRTKDFR